MIFISHRGNLNGRQPENENKPEYIIQALLKGYHVECDVWYGDRYILLGHDKPKYQVTKEFLNNECIICHAKDLYTLDKLIHDGLYVLSNDKDKYCELDGYIWQWDLTYFTNRSIVMIKDFNENILSNIIKCVGICSDYIAEYRKILG